MTIKDIARECGYSVSTVSRALNKHPDVSGDAKKKIDEIVERYRFVPNNNARQLKQQQTQNLAIIVKGTKNMFFSTVLEKMHVLIAEEGYDAVVRYIDEFGDEIGAAAQICRESKPLGIIFLGGDREAFRRGFGDISVPSVLATGLDYGLTFKNLSMVGVNDEKAGHMAAEHLVTQGHKNIAVLGGDLETSGISRFRLIGCKRCFSEHGMTFNDDLYSSVAFSYTGAYHGMQSLLSAHPELTAIFAMSDVMAIGAIRAIVDAGLRVPEDISVIGFDGIELGGYYNPALTTIAQPVDKIAEISVELLIKSIKRGSPASSAELAASLTQGESVRRLESGG